MKVSRVSRIILLSMVFLLCSLAVAFAEADKDLLVVEGLYDQIEDVIILTAPDFLERIEIISNSKSAITSAIDSGKYKALFINCSDGQSDKPDQDLLDKVRSFVHGGGMLYVTDHAANFLKPWEAEMEYVISYDLHIYRSGNWKTTVVDPALKAFFTADRFDASGEILIHHSQDNGEPIINPGKANVLLRNSPSGTGTGFVPGQAQAIDFNPAAGGRVVYTTFHNHPLGSSIQPGTENYIAYQNAITVMKYICGSLGTASEQDALLTLLGAKPTDVIGSPQGGQFSDLVSRGWTFFVDNATSAQLTFALYASTVGANSTTLPVFTLTAPDGTIYKAYGDPRVGPVVFHVQRQSGLWSIQATDNIYVVPGDQIVTGMVLAGKFGTASPLLEPDDDNDEKVGCNTIAGLLIALSAFPILFARKKR